MVEIRNANNNAPFDTALLLQDTRIMLAVDEISVEYEDLDGETEQENFDGDDSRLELDKNIRIAGLFSTNISDIKINCSEGKMAILAKNSDKGEIETLVEASLKNEPFEVSLNFHYLLDGLKILDTEKIIIEFTGQGSPLVIRPNDDKKDVVYLIMPLRS